MLECVPNVSAGRDVDAITGLAASCGPPLLDVHTDADHNRSVFTLAAPDADAVVRRGRGLGARGRGRVCRSWSTRASTRGSGALDVVPFVALTGDPAVATRRRAEFARLVGDVVRGAGLLLRRRRRAPPLVAGDASGRVPSRVRRISAPRDRTRELGATAVGARAPLVAINCLLDTADVEIARAAARVVRERDGGLPGVRALGFFLAAAGRAQVSMNVTDLVRDRDRGRLCNRARCRARTRDGCRGSGAGRPVAPGRARALLARVPGLDRARRGLDDRGPDRPRA